MGSFASNSLQGVKLNSLLTSLNIKQSERLIAIRENGLADANFLLTNLMQQIFAEQDSKLCLVIMHNTIGHYHNVLKRLGCDLLQKIENGDAVTIEPLKMIVEDIGKENECKAFLTLDKEVIVKQLFLDLNKKIEELLKMENSGQVYLMIDDVSHLLDLGVDVKYLATFLNCCMNLTSNERVSVVINCHVATANDEVVSNILSYTADLNIEVSPLKTGVSQEVTGIIRINRKDQFVEASLKQNVFHYKTFGREIKTFTPGESLRHLYK